MSHKILGSIRNSGPKQNLDIYNKEYQCQYQLPANFVSNVRKLGPAVGHDFSVVSNILETD